MVNEPLRLTARPEARSRLHLSSRPGAVGTKHAARIPSECALLRLSALFDADSRLIHTDYLKVWPRESSRWTAILLLPRNELARLAYAMALSIAFPFFEIPLG